MARPKRKPFYAEMVSEDILGNNIWIIEYNKNSRVVMEYLVSSEVKTTAYYASLNCLKELKDYLVATKKSYSYSEALEWYDSINSKGNYLITLQRLNEVYETGSIKQYCLYHVSDRTSPFIYTIINGRKNRMSERNIERILEKYGDIARKSCPDIPAKIHPHMLRRTRATGWYRDGVPIETIAVLLGHSNIQTTRKSYAKPSTEMLRSEMAKSDTPLIEELSEKPLWENEDELAMLCGLR